jgi:diadenosine tetraphosphate (Ap4A) HIT family hydrolase
MDPSETGSIASVRHARPSHAFSQACPLCLEEGGQRIWSDDLLRVVLPDEPDVPGFVRVILQHHCAEMTDLDDEARRAMMRAVWGVERAIREILAPDKINLASLGNQVPHLHWHVIPRWRDDPWFPAAIWAPRRVLDEAAQSALARRRAMVSDRLLDLHAAILQHVQRAA